MERYYVGLDVPKDETAICVKSGDGKVLLARKMPTDPDAIAGALSCGGWNFGAVVMETGRMANWLYHKLMRRAPPVVCVDALHAYAVLSQMHNKTDANDAAMLAELARTGFYRKVTVKSPLAQRRRALLRARETAIKMRMNTENTIRGLLASFGVRLPRHLRTEVFHQAAELSKAMLRHAREDQVCQRLMTIPGVGAVSAVTFVATVDDPQRFRRSRSVGAYAGLTSRRYQSGDMDYGGRISGRGDRMLRPVLYEAANSLLCGMKAEAGQGMKEWATVLKQRTSHKKAVVALALKLAVIMHAIWRNGTTFQSTEA
ncbi:IS110 family transposase [Paracoccus sp. SCSIO 75233]|uniref:IS110 family transposase n=1 Tax=Paracoccus sp. SCSIO 75233 TaxID=3017782 RepID=UPI0022F07B65|nr:IS110 family transposase [Paracoccus sp. SCSIO 75233]WBU53972.1 IS110 family transposase [Paracoccus sp. SCSIO 75233]